MRYSVADNLPSHFGACFSAFFTLLKTKINASRGDFDLCFGPYIARQLSIFCCVLESKMLDDALEFSLSSARPVRHLTQEKPLAPKKTIDSFLAVLAAANHLAQACEASLLLTSAS